MGRNKKIGLVYMMLTIPSLRVKVGQTSWLSKRRADISDSLRWQIAIPVMVVFSADYLDVEKHIHRVFDFCRYEYRGSGKSEYFLTMYAPVIWLYMLGLQIFVMIKLLIYVAAIIFAIWVMLQIVTG